MTKLQLILTFCLLLSIVNCDLIDVPIYILNKKIEFLRRIQNIKNSFNPMGYDPYYPNSYGFQNNYGSYYDNYSNRYNNINPFNGYSNSYPDYQNVIQNRISKRDVLMNKNKNYELLTNMKD